MFSAYDCPDARCILLTNRAIRVPSTQKIHEQDATGVPHVQDYEALEQALTADPDINYVMVDLDSFDSATAQLPPLRRIRDSYRDRLVILLSANFETDEFGTHRKIPANDTPGHSAAESAQIHVTHALKSEVGTGAMVARIGDDEFVAGLPDSRAPGDLREIAGRIGRSVAAPPDRSDRPIPTSCSMDASLSLPGERDPNSLLRQADFALEEARHLGRAGAAIYDEALHRRHRVKAKRASDLAEAIDSATLDHVFQPVCDLRSQSVVGFETLVRWTHPEAGTIGPDEFLPIADELGLMAALDLGSMSKALEQKRLLEAGGHDGLTVAFNASGSLLSHPDFVNRLVRGTDAGGLSRDQVAIEVLETTSFGEVTENSVHAATIRDLHEAGFKVYLDDFGVGYAGLAHLAELAVTGVKIDRSLIRNVLRDETAAKIAGKIIELCHDLGLNIVAEGVEDSQTANTLLNMGCTTVQGFWISRPLHPEDLHHWLPATNDHRRCA